MRSNLFLILPAFLFVCSIAVSSCQSARKITFTKSRTEMTAEWDSMPNEKAINIFAPYKAKVDELMNPIIGKCAINMTAQRPESLLSNLVANIIRNSTTPHTGRPADIAIINIGGLRNSLSAGDISLGTIYEILPFENHLCILSLRGKDVKELMQDIVKAGGEGLSNVYITVNKNMNVTGINIGKDPLRDDQLYEIATINYLAEGNGRMTVLRRADKKQCIETTGIRELLIEYIKNETAQGRDLTSRMEGHITIVDN